MRAKLALTRICGAAINPASPGKIAAMPLKLIVANKAYSSWSLRPWILLRHFDIPFEEVVIPLDTPDTHASILKYAPSGKCPSLRDGATVVWELLAIIEYIAETHPEKAIWPRGKAARAHARALASEMHAGFAALREACPTNFRRPPGAIALSEPVRADVARIEFRLAPRPRDVRQGGAVPVRALLGRRRHVRPGRQPLPCLPNPGREADAGLYGGGDGASRLEGLDRRGRGRAVADREIRGARPGRPSLSVLPAHSPPRASRSRPRASPAPPPGQGHRDRLDASDGHRWRKTQCDQALIAVRAKNRP